MIKPILLLAASITLASCYTSKPQNLYQLSTLPAGNSSTISLVFDDEDGNWIEQDLTHALRQSSYKVLVDKTQRVYPEGQSSSSLGTSSRSWENVTVANTKSADYVFLVECACSARFAKNMNLQIIDKSTGELVWDTLIGEPNEVYKIDKIKAMVQDALAI